MNKVRFGIIGLGNQGTSYLTGHFDSGKIENGVVTAGCDINPAKIKHAKSITKSELAYFTDYRDMIKSGLVDAVLIETPHYLHPEIAIECLKAGIHVLCDKPAGVYTKQVREMNEAAKKSKAVFGMMFNQRTNCVYRKMREIVRAGGIGELQRVVWVITDWFRTQIYYDSGSWRATWAGEGGGVLINQCPHQLDLISWVVGELPTSVRGFCKYGKWHDIEVEDDVTAYLEYANGATGVFVTTTGETPGTNRFEISGTRGKLLCENGKLVHIRNKESSTDFSKTAKEPFGRPERETVTVETDGQNPQHAGIINNFTNAVLGKEPLFVSGEEGICGVELMNAIELSGWRDGARVTLPVNEEEYLAELNARRATSRLKTADDDAVTNTIGTYGTDNGHI